MTDWRGGEGWVFDEGGNPVEITSGRWKVIGTYEWNSGTVGPSATQEVALVAKSGSVAPLWPVDQDGKLRPTGLPPDNDGSTSGHGRLLAYTGYVISTLAGGTGTPKKSVTVGIGKELLFLKPPGVGSDGAITEQRSSFNIYSDGQVIGVTVTTEAGEDNGGIIAWGEFTIFDLGLDC